MYTPKHFREDDPECLRAFIREHGFGTLITAVGGDVRASHLPFLVDVDLHGATVLHAHVARANDHWRHGAREALATFLGPHHYVSPTWYREPGTVPTWSYVAVHARGTLEWLDDPHSAQALLERMVEHYEQRSPTPWRADFEAAYIRGEMRAIVPLRIAVTSLEGKWKLNQHHPLERRERTAHALEELGSDDARAIAAAMRATIERDRAAR